jgi:hypothetical protein
MNSGCRKATDISPTARAHLGPFLFSARPVGSEAGFDDHLTKPGDHDVVRGLIGKLEKRATPRS